MRQDGAAMGGGNGAAATSQPAGPSARRFAQGPGPTCVIGWGECGGLVPVDSIVPAGAGAEAEAGVHTVGAGTRLQAAGLWQRVWRQQEGSEQGSGAVRWGALVAVVRSAQQPALGKAGP